MGRTLLGRENVQKGNSILIHGLKPMVWLDGQELGRSVIGKLVRKTLRKRYTDGPFHVGKGCAGICVPCSSPNVTLSEKKYSNQLNR